MMHDSSVLVLIQRNFMFIFICVLFGWFDLVCLVCLTLALDIAMHQQKQKQTQREIINFNVPCTLRLSQPQPKLQNGAIQHASMMQHATRNMQHATWEYPTRQPKEQPAPTSTCIWKCPPITPR